MTRQTTLSIIFNISNIQTSFICKVNECRVISSTPPTLPNENQQYMAMFIALYVNHNGAISTENQNGRQEFDVTTIYLRHMTSFEQSALG